MKVKVQIKGMDDLLKDFKKVTPQKQTEIMTTALSEGAEIIKNRAVANAPKKSGRLKNAIRVRKSALKTPGKARVTVEVGQGKWFKGEDFYAAFQEFGWKVGKRVRRRIAGSNRFARDTRKVIPPKYYMAGAMEQVGEQAMSTSIKSIESQLDKAGF